MNKTIICQHCKKQEVYHIEEVYDEGMVWCSSCGGWNNWQQQKKVLAKRKVKK
jgi:hypothetical protein